MVDDGAKIRCAGDIVNLEMERKYNAVQEVETPLFLGDFFGPYKGLLN